MSIRLAERQGRRQQGGKKEVVTRSKFCLHRSGSRCLIAHTQIKRAAAIVCFQNLLELAAEFLSVFHLLGSLQTHFKGTTFFWLLHSACVRRRSRHTFRCMQQTGFDHTRHEQGSSRMLLGSFLARSISDCFERGCCRRLLPEPIEVHLLSAKPRACIGPRV